MRAHSNAVDLRASSLIIDAAEHNPLKVNGASADLVVPALTIAPGKSVWAQYMNLKTGASKGITLQTNSFCAGGAYLSNNTLLSLGGNGRVGLGDKSGEQAIRFFNCDDGGCSVKEYPTRVQLAARRWYPTSVRLPDGSAFIAGGAHVLQSEPA